jgi:glycosyltransferase involved in cell wall biosynthesis
MLRVPGGKNGKIKIFYFIPNLQQGGTERQILELIRNLPERFEPILCLYHDNIFFREELPPDQPRYVLGQEKMNLQGLLKLADILRDEKPDIVHSFRDKSNFWARVAALWAGMPIIISSCRNRMIQPRYLLVEKLLSDRCQAVLTNSEGVRRELTHLARVNPERIQVIHNILDIEFFRPPSEKERSEARERWRLTGDRPVLLLPGRIGLQKNQLAILLALNRLLDKNRIPEDTLLLLPGRKRDLGTASMVNILAKKARLREQVRFLGAQREMRSLYWAADMLVMPSLWEGLSNAALEACACGLPAILSHAANVDRVVEPGSTGIEVPTWSWTGLARALEKMLARSSAELRAMGLRGREHVAARFAPTPNHIVDRTVQVYDQLLEANRSGDQ